MQKIVIGSDNAGYSLKKVIVQYLGELEVDYEDVGVDSEKAEDLYADVAAKVVKMIKESDYKKEGILICGTGIGMAITANKYSGIYAAVCHDIYSTKRSKLSNSANIMTMGARVIGPELAKELVKTWLTLEFIPGRSSKNIDAIKNVEDVNFKI